MTDTNERTIRARYLRLIDDRARLLANFSTTTLAGEQFGWTNDQYRVISDLDGRLAQTRRQLAALVRERVTS